MRFISVKVRGIFVKNNRHGQSAILSNVDYLKIHRQLKSNSHRLFFDIARYTGERWGAIAQLQVGDVYADPLLSLPHEVITFRASTRKASPTGERVTRQVPIHIELQQILMLYNPPMQGSAWLFPSTDANKSISFSAADKWLRAAVAAAGLGHRGISTHSTRRTLITRLSEASVDVKTIQAITGHRDIKALMRYVEVSPDRVRAAMSLI
jgi:integrase/recombinase XerD